MKSDPEFAELTREDLVLLPGVENFLQLFSKVSHIFLEVLWSSSRSFLYLWLEFSEVPCAISELSELLQFLSGFPPQIV